MNTVHNLLLVVLLGVAALVPAMVSAQNPVLSTTDGSVGVNNNKNRVLINFPHNGGIEHP
jgi:hypothetical protein